MGDEKTAKPTATKDAKELNGKEAIYEKIATFVQEKTEKRIGKTGGHFIFDMVVEGIFSAVAKGETFRFNGGFGSLHVKKYGAGSRNLPSGTKVNFGERTKVRYEEGVSVKDLLKPGTKTRKPAKKVEVKTAETLDLA